MSTNYDIEIPQGTDDEYNLDDDDLFLQV